jgi:group II intron reverse transcriptase/maturase
MSAASKPLGQAMYVALQSDKDWIQSVQRTLYTRSKNDLDYVFDKLWGLVTDPRNLRFAAARVARNKGHRTAGVDGITVRKIAHGEGIDPFLSRLRAELRTRSYRPSPARRVLIPKPGQPGKYRPLGIPTVKDRIVQAALKNVLEPIFEADFYPVSYGFRPGKSVFGALEHLRMLLRPWREAETEAQRRLPYQWAIEGDIRGCFDHIDHHALMVRVRRRVGDPKVCQLITVFLKSGVMSGEQYTRTDFGTPQGGILSPLLANIALSAIEERYERHVWPRRAPTIRTEAAKILKRASGARVKDKASGRPVCFPIRYADDFIILVSVPYGPELFERARSTAIREKNELANFLKQQLGLELSETKTLVTPVTTAMKFLGHHVRVRRHPSHHRWVSTSVVPKDRTQLLRERIKCLFDRDTVRSTLGERLQRLNPMLRGWSYFYRHAWGAKHVLSSLDHYVWWTILRWLKKKHPRTPVKELFARYSRRRPRRRSTQWTDGKVAPFEASSVRVQQFKLGWLKGPDFARSMESPVHNERCPPGSGRGTRKPLG